MHFALGSVVHLLLFQVYIFTRGYLSFHQISVVDGFFFKAFSRLIENNLRKRKAIDRHVSLLFANLVLYLFIHVSSLSPAVYLRVLWSHDKCRIDLSEFIDCRVMNTAWHQSLFCVFGKATYTPSLCAQCNYMYPIYAAKMYSSLVW